jgi:hypothetical protein
MVAILRGIPQPRSLLGMSLHEPDLIGCVNAGNELSLIPPSQSGGHLDCHLMQPKDLREPARAQVQAGLPTGSKDNAIAQLRELSKNSLLPPCPPPRATSPPGPQAPTTTSGEPTEPTATTPNTPPSGTPTSAPASTPPAAPATTSPMTSQTVTALPPPPLQPGVECRAVA